MKSFAEASHPTEFCHHISFRNGSGIGPWKQKMRSGIFTLSAKGNTAEVMARLIGETDPLVQQRCADIALLYAAWKGQTDTVHALCEWGANVNFQDAEGHTPLMFAARWEHRDVVVQLLAYGAQIEIKNTKGAIAADYVSRKNSTDDLIDLLTPRT